MMRQICIPDEDLSGSAAWVETVIQNRFDAVMVIGERLELRQRMIAEKDARIAELESQLATSEELAEQHLREIDSLELQLRHMKRAGE